MADQDGLNWGSLNWTMGRMSKFEWQLKISVEKEELRIFSYGNGVQLDPLQ